MKIGIDARNLASEHYTGIARCVYEDIYIWIKDYPEHEFYLFSGQKLNIPLELPSNWHVMDEPWIINSGKLWSIIKLPKMIKKLKLDVFWGPSFYLPKKVKGTRYYVTIHDLALFKFKGIGEFKNTLRIKLLTKKSCKKADKIIAVSKATADDVHELFNVRKDKIKVCYNGGLPTEFKTNKLKSNIISDNIIFKEEFFLFMSTIEPRKNICTIISAFEKFVRDNNSKMKLVLAGKRGWKCDDIYKKIENSKYRDQIIITGFISDSDKEYLLKNAKAFVYPSLYEGFGIPILEAFSYNIPVITSRKSSMPEVGGNVAFYIEDPLDVDGLALQMLNIINMDTQAKHELDKKMNMQVAKFSWGKNAKEIMKVFEEQ